jgi:hypothetical protein
MYSLAQRALATYGLLGSVSSITGTRELSSSSQIGSLETGKGRHCLLQHSWHIYAECNVRHIEAQAKVPPVRGP